MAHERTKDRHFIYLQVSMCFASCSVPIMSHFMRAVAKSSEFKPDIALAVFFLKVGVVFRGEIQASFLKLGIVSSRNERCSSCSRDNKMQRFASY